MSGEITPGLFLRRLAIAQAVGMVAVAGGAAYYFTHPQRVIADLPNDLAESCQDVYLRGADGAQLHAFWLSAREARNGSTGASERTIVHQHGFNSSGGILLARELLRHQRHDRPPLTAWPLVRAGLQRGYNFLLTDMRGHGRSEGPWDVTGKLIAQDLMSWVRWLRGQHGQLWVGLWGNSFGSSIGLYLATGAAGGGFDAMVLDSPAISGAGLYSGVIQKPVYWAVQPVFRRMAGLRLLYRLQNAHVWMPTLLIHGLDDRHVPVWHSQEAFRLLSADGGQARTDMWLVPGANHLEALEVAPEVYIERTLAWYDRWF